MDFMALSAKAVRLSSLVATAIWKGFSTMASNSKQPKLAKLIGTHDGVFHCDEALACYMLRQLPDYRDATIVRTRDASVLSTCDIVVDVGGDYYPEKHRFDHHQRGFEESLSSIRPELAKNKTIKLSSAGLVYAHYGLEVISEILKSNEQVLPRDGLTKIYVHVYEDFVEEIDAIDNGVPICLNNGTQRYRINTSISARVGHLNPQWNSSTLVTPELFEKAISLVGTEFAERVIDAATVWWPSRAIVQRAIENRMDVDKSGEIIMLEKFCPWIEHFHAIESEMNLQDTIKFCIFQDKNDSWRTRAIPVQPDSFVCRVFLHKDWRGVRNGDLSKVAKIPDCMFCHATGFIGGNKTKEGAIQMALKSIHAAVADRE